ncbi:MAG TPA: hypothetical protein VFX60_02170 [Micromonospora sp.]|nr:hypothetical protein [Micromonospora sp.]
MRSRAANVDSRLSRWLRVREFAVPPSMIEFATARRRVGDWAGACAAARCDVGFNLRAVARTHGRELAARIRDDLRHLAPDLLRWHMPRIAPDGLLRPGLIVSLARYDAAEPGDGAMHLVARTPPAWADAGQRISLALWDGSGAGSRRCPHPQPHPNRRFRLDLHRHLWDARRADELRIRSGADRQPADGVAGDPELLELVPQGRGCAVDRWAAEAAILLGAEGRTSGMVAVRLGVRHRLVLDVVAGGEQLGPPTMRTAAESAAFRTEALPMLPDAAMWVLPDLELLRSGLIEADRLHPLVASALVPDHPPSKTPKAPDQAGQPRLVQCRGALHRIGLVNGVLTPLDHDPAEVRREELLAALTGTPLPCLRAIDEAHRHPECLADIRARLDHGDTAGALAAVEALLGSDALLRSGALRDELETAAQRRITYGLFRAGLVGSGPVPTSQDRRRTPDHRSHPRQALFR